MDNKPVKIGLLGLGTVGTGVVKVLENFPHVQIKRITRKNIDKPTTVNVQSVMTQDPYAVINDPEISIVVEVIGGVEPAMTFVTEAIKKGKHVVTANKELIAKKGAEIFSLARKHNVIVLYEASVAGGIPVIMPIKQSLSANKISSLAGILNGTTNYILTKMEEDRSDFPTILKEAQDLGYAEADPSSDVEGYDAAYKLSILSSISFGMNVDVSKVHCEGISKIEPVDIDYASELGYKIKLIALAQLVNDNAIDIRVHPAFVCKKHPLASINGVTNALSVCGDAVGEVNFSGPGAGELPTASSVVADILAIASDISSCDEVLPSMKFVYKNDYKLVPIEETLSSYYVRLNAKDVPGVIGKMGMICGEHGVSLSAVLQKDMLDDGCARIILMTHQVKESDMIAAIEEIEKLSTTKLVANVIRVYK